MDKRARNTQRLKAALASWSPALSGSLTGHRGPLRAQTCRSKTLACTRSYVTGSPGEEGRGGQSRGLRTLAKDLEQETS